MNTNTPYLTMPTSNNIHRLSPAAQQIVAAYAKRRGICPAQLNDFLNPKLELGGRPLPDAQKALARLTLAAARKEAVLIFGDYDADGITAVSILLRCLRECSAIEPRWALPNRQVDEYGLSLAKARSLLEHFKPALIVCVDCGTNSVQAIGWLKQQGVDTIVIDHHPAEGLSSQAVALVNPKAHPDGQYRELDELCAAGLALLLCHQLTRFWCSTGKWDCMAATMLAGLGTLADAVAMTPINRAIAKEAIGLINNPAMLSRVAGLAALVPSDGQRISQRRLQFEVVPPLNALGRLASAEPGVTLLTTADPGQAQRIAVQCLELNESRKAKQQEMVEQAAALARAVLEHHPAAPALVLADPRWHHGIAGPGASQIGETFGRSTILLARDGAVGQWKGSGRSANGDDLGGWIRAVKALGLLERGGGHAGAVGLTTTSAQLAALQSAALILPMPQADGGEPESEVVGEIDQLGPEEWLHVIEVLEPFGRGNPFPRIAATDVVCLGKPTPLALKESGRTWGVKAEFKLKSGERIAAVWRDCDTALRLWTPGKRLDSELELTAKAYRGRLFFNWSVPSCSKTKYCPL